MHFNAQTWRSCGDVKLINPSCVTLSGDGVWTWPDRNSGTTKRRVDMADGLYENWGLSVGSNVKLWSQKCCFLFCSGGLLKSENESAGVQSYCRGQHSHSRTDPVSSLYCQKLTLYFGSIYLSVLMVSWDHGVVVSWAEMHNQQNLCCCSVEDEKLRNLIFWHYWNFFR